MLDERDRPDNAGDGHDPGDVSHDEAFADYAPHADGMGTEQTLGVKWVPDPGKKKEEADAAA